ncbi:DNA cytosine methyltransferase [Halomonas denitrificans]|nr:DNA cytosine methyltransferase [Halomonas denitrificans]
MAEVFKAVSLFSGAGGLDIGLEQAGFELIRASDFDGSCVETLRANQLAGIRINAKRKRRYLEGATIGHEDISGLSLKEELGESPDILVGGPPCQPFSSAGAQRSVADSRGRLFEDFVRIADEIKPRRILFENVRGLVTARGPGGIPGEALNLVRLSFERIGYRTNFSVLNAADFGVPQRRVRLFMLASLEEPPPEFPTPSHSKDERDGLPPWVTMAAALQDIMEPENEMLVQPSASLFKQLSELKPGTGLKSRGVKEPTRPGGHWGYKQGAFVADQNLPARTVTASSSQDWIWDTRNRLRRITVAEAAALQGFPSEWVFTGSRAARYRQIGNAVPPPLGKVLGRALIDSLSGAHEGENVSKPFPDYMTAAVRYTEKEDKRNGSVRVRSPYYAAGR